MKKYFLLFATLFMIGVAATSTYSYGMFPQFEEETQSIVLHNSQNQKICKIALHKENPAADNRLFRYGDGKITIFLGTSTAGKTTLIEQQKNIEPHSLNYDLDYRSHLAGDKLIKKYAPEEFQAISEVTQQRIINVAGECNDHLKFQPKTSTEQQEKAKRALIRLKENMIREDFPKFPSEPVMIEKIFYEIVRHSQERKSVIFDAIGIGQIYNFLNTNIVAPVEVRLLFCPLSTLSKRIEIRNKKAIEEGQFSNMREGFPLWQYTRLYHAKQSSDEPTLEILKRAQAEAAFHQHLSNEIEKKPIFLQRLGFTSPEIEQVEITSRFKHYSYIIYSY